MPEAEGEIVDLDDDEDDEDEAEDAEHDTPDEPGTGALIREEPLEDDEEDYEEGVQSGFVSMQHPVSCECECRLITETLCPVNVN